MASYDGVRVECAHPGEDLTGSVTAAVQRHTVGRALGFLGEPTVNVVALNAELDAAHPVHR